MTTDKDSADIEIEINEIESEEEKKAHEDNIDDKEEGEDDIMNGKATVEDISRIVHKGKKILSLRSIRRRKPRLIRKLYFYWVALMRNNSHKMDYIRLKSKLLRLINITETYTSYVERHSFIQPYCGIDTEEEPLDLTMIIDLFIRLEGFIKEFTPIFWYYRIPYDMYIRKYLSYRDDICNIRPSKYIRDENRIKKRTFKKLLKRTNYIVGELVILSDFLKDNVDRLDDLQFKVTIMFINLLIFFGQFMWNQWQNIYNFFRDIEY